MKLLARLGAVPHINPMTDHTPIPRGRRCPICGKPTAEQFRPFCSRRCADVDLNRWLSDVYAVPAKDDEEEDERPAPKPANDPL
jgi:endogenous inhibitor of DNA gyrase (YacG/DUF329 family)